MKRSFCLSYFLVFKRIPFTFRINSEKRDKKSLNLIALHCILFNFKNFIFENWIQWIEWLLIWTLFERYFYVDLCIYSMFFHAFIPCFSVHLFHVFIRQLFAFRNFIKWIIIFLILNSFVFIFSFMLSFFIVHSFSFQRTFTWTE